MRSLERQLFASLAVVVSIAASSPPTHAQTGEPARIKVAETPKLDPALIKAGTPLPKPAPAQRPPAANAAIPKAAPASAVDVKKMEDLLKRWESQSKQISSLVVQYVRVDDDRVFSSTKKYEGQAMLQKPDLVYFDFYEVVPGKTKAFDERIVCDGKNVYQFKGASKQIFVYPLPKNQQEKALNQGALPFLFDMSVAKAKNRYEMSFRGEDETSYFIKIIPLLAIDREEYSQAMLQLSKDRLLPMAIKLTSPGGKETKLFTFLPEKSIPNGPIAPAAFDGTSMAEALSKKSGWKVIYNPDPSGVPQPAAAPAVGARPAPRVGTRPAAPAQGGRR